MEATDPITETVNAVYVAESRRVLATLIRLLGDFEVAEEALHDAFRAALEQWPRDGVPANPRAWLVSTGRFKAIDGLRRRARFDAAGRGRRRSEARRRRCGGVVGRGERRGRSAASHLHLLPSGSRARRPDRADAARGLRTDHRRDRAGVSDAGADAGAADRSCEGEDPKREHSVSGADPGGAAGAARLGPAGDLSRLQRRLRGLLGSVPYSPRPVGRGDQARPAARRPVARAGSGRIARTHAAAGVAARGAIVAVRRIDPARSSRIARCGIGGRSPKGSGWSSVHCHPGAPAHIRSRRRLPRCTPRRWIRRLPTGTRSSGCTTSSPGRTLHRSSS